MCSVHLGKVLQPPEVQKDREFTELSGVDSFAEAKNLSSSSAGIIIEGVDDMLIKISRCCNPVPGDAVMGFITSGRGISVHKKQCVNLHATDPRRWIDVEWSGNHGAGHRVEIWVSAENAKGVVAAISASISSDDANIVEISAHITPTDTADFNITLEVDSLEHLQQILQHQ